MHILGLAAFLRAAIFFTRFSRVGRAAPGRFRLIAASPVSLNIRLNN